MFPQGTVLDGLPNIATSQGSTRIEFPRPGAMTPAPTRSSKGSVAHATTLGVVYVNEIGRAGFGKEPFVFPTGSIIVRERLLTPSSTPDELVVMLKHERNFNRKTNGWEFLTISGDTRKIEKRQAGQCLRCHTSAVDNDFVFPEDGRKY